MLHIPISPVSWAGEFQWFHMVLRWSDSLNTVKLRCSCYISFPTEMQKRTLLGFTWQIKYHQFWAVVTSCLCPLGGAMLSHMHLKVWGLNLTPIAFQTSWTCCQLSVVYFFIYSYSSVDSAHSLCFSESLWFSLITSKGQRVRLFRRYPPANTFMSSPHGGASSLSYARRRAHAPLPTWWTGKALPHPFLSFLQVKIDRLSPGFDERNLQRRCGSEGERDRDGGERLNGSFCSKSNS